MGLHYPFLSLGLTVSLYLALWIKRDALRGGPPLNWGDRATLLLPLLVAGQQQLDSSGIVAVALQVLGWGICITSIQQLSAGKLATTGPYYWVRHPMYTGYLIWIGGAISPVTWFSGLVWLWLLWGLQQRLSREEQALLDNDYKTYSLKTPYRLLPGIY